MTGTRELEGRVAIVTGAARNIGRIMALELARAGAAVIVNARTSQTEAQSVVDEIVAAGGKAKAVLANVVNPNAVDALIGATVREFGGVDILVNSAAVRRETAFANMTFAEWRDVISIILDGAFLTTHAALPYLRKSRRGAVVNIGGLSAHTGAGGRAHVVTAKAGLSGFTRALAHDLAGDGITVNCVSPGMIDTVRAGAEPSHHAGKLPPVGRFGTAEEVASLVRYLCGPAARYITGQTVHVNGGAFMA
ncbi:3-oxoacyl-ACP reductase family protein [Mesorhizobium sp. VK4C]|uniref:3-oxoacyl-ACP reductase family protein n=1 Tax=Mesorhizobium captivum TaxID=3072319 RepID=UPI002A24B773|nr:3-oxoacyl-ACP reductase family protein [Mesorhizobium sp. VK4C]MDX8497914.1 3-oxoacyl-ACP reductase family protein [Mesorhizobium sp. VK4C]